MEIAFADLKPGMIAKIGKRYILVVDLIDKNEYSKPVPRYIVLNDDGFRYIDLVDSSLYLSTTVDGNQDRFKCDVLAELELKDLAQMLINAIEVLYE